MVQTILGYFPHLVCKPYFDCLALGGNAIFKQSVSQDLAGPSACCWQDHALGFEQSVSQDLAGPSCLLLTRSCSGVWKVCKSGSGWPFLCVADKSMLWVLNSGWVRIWLALPACCWQEHALGFKQHVSQDLAGPSFLLLTGACSGFGTACKSGSGWPFLLVADRSMLWVLNRM